MYRLWTLFVVVVVAPNKALADAGTPLIWLGILHLAIGNLVIGVGEGFIIFNFFKQKMKRSIGIMILANYVSAGIGAYCIYLISTVQPEWLLKFYFFHLKVALGLIFLFLFSVAVIAEMLFVEWILAEKNWKKAFKISLIVQSVSYGFLAPFYYLSSSAQ